MFAITALSTYVLFAASVPTDTVSIPCILPVPDKTILPALKARLLASKSPLTIKPVFVLTFLLATSGANNKLPVLSIPK